MSTLAVVLERPSRLPQTPRNNLNHETRRQLFPSHITPAYLRSRSNQGRGSCTRENRKRKHSRQCSHTGNLEQQWGGRIHGILDWAGQHHGCVFDGKMSQMQTTRQHNLPIIHAMLDLGAQNRCLLLPFSTEVPLPATVLNLVGQFRVIPKTLRNMTSMATSKQLLPNSAHSQSPPSQLHSSLL